MVGKTFEGYYLSSFEYRYMRITFLNDSLLQYQLGIANVEYNGAIRKVNWEQSKTVNYSLDVTRLENQYDKGIVCKLVFAGYTSENIFQEYGENDFVQEIVIPDGAKIIDSYLLKNANN